MAWPSSARQMGVPAMPAGVDQNLRAAVVGAHDDDAVFADEGHVEVAGIGNCESWAMKFQARAKMRSNSNS